MGTEEDKPNTGVLVTLFVIGAAAMLGGSAAIVGMTRTEMAAQSDQLSAYADLDSVRSLRDAQQKVLREAKLPIDRARDELLSEIQRNPRNASWATPELAASATASAAAEGAGGAGGAAAEGTAGAAAGGAAPDGAQPDAAETSAPPAAGGTTGAPAPEATPTEAPKTPPAPLPKGFGAAGGSSAPPATSN